MNPVLIALLIPFLGTALGSAFVFFMKLKMPQIVQKLLLGFASGVMVAASVWSLIIPSIEMGTGQAAILPPHDWTSCRIRFLAAHRLYHAAYPSFR